MKEKTPISILETIPFKDYLRDFKSLIERISLKYPVFTKTGQRRSISNSEMFWIYGLIRHIKPQFVFESGVLRGRSTLILAETMQDIGHVYCASLGEHEDFALFRKDYSNLTTFFEPGQECIEKVPSDKTFVTLIDGPKARSHEARVLYYKARQMPLLRGVFQHDIMRERDNRSFRLFFGKRKRIDWKFHIMSDEFASQFSDCEFDALETFRMTGNFGAWSPVVP